jgi:hypothetical protein
MPFDQKPKTPGELGLPPLHGYRDQQSPLEPYNVLAPQTAAVTKAPAAPAPLPAGMNPAAALKPWDARQWQDFRRDLADLEELIGMASNSNVKSNDRTNTSTNGVRTDAARAERLDQILRDVHRHWGQPKAPAGIPEEALRRAPELINAGETVEQFIARATARLHHLGLITDHKTAALSLASLFPERQRQVAQEVCQSMKEMMGAAFSLANGFDDAYRPDGVSGTDGQGATDPAVQMLNAVDATLAARRKQVLDETFAAAGYYAPSLTKEQIEQVKALFARAADLMRCGHVNGRLQQACDNLRQILDGSSRGSPQALNELKGAVEALEWTARGWPAL